jgi:hypothetical protein
MEAVDVLYTQNHFSFRGARGVIELHSLLASSNWHALRHVHISTLFLTPMARWMNCSLPPENYNQWQTACEALCTLKSLHLLKIDMVVWNQQDHNSNGVSHEALVFIFKALEKVHAQTFQIELNMELPDSVKEAIGGLHFEISLKERPYDGTLFRLH